jgi:putative endonuclease
MNLVSMDASPVQPWWRRWFGARSERAAERFLAKKGYRILKRNFTCPLGELDLVALDGREVVFVEVRSTESEDRERPAASVGDRKQERLTRLALFFLKKYQLLDHAARFDVLSINWPEGCTEPEIHHHCRAFEASDDFQMYS